jgi:hypothetical protein
MKNEEGRRTGIAFSLMAKQYFCSNRQVRGMVCLRGAARSVPTSPGRVYTDLIESLLHPEIDQDQGVAALHPALISSR